MQPDGAVHVRLREHESLWEPGSSCIERKGSICAIDSSSSQGDQGTGIVWQVRKWSAAYVLTSTPLIC